MSISLTPQLLFILLGVTCLFVSIASSKDKPLEIYVLKVPGLEKASRIGVAILGMILIVFPFIPPVRNLVSPEQPTSGFSSSILTTQATLTGTQSTGIPSPLASIPTDSPTAIPPSATATIVPTQPPLAKELPRLEETIYGRFDPNVPANIQLDAGRVYRFTGDRSGRYCRAEFPPNGLIWVLCIKIGEPEPTQIPATRIQIAPTQIQIPPTAPPSPTPATSVTYRVGIVKISLAEMKALAGCESPLPSNNACIVGPSKLNMELVDLDADKIFPFPSDARLVTVFAVRTRVNVVSDHSGLIVFTIGNNEFVPEPGQYYKIVVNKVG